MAGYFGGVLDDVISRVIDTLLAFPGLLLAIALVAVLGPSLGNVLFALTIIGWVGYARLVRGQVLRAREFEYVQAARALGAQTPRMLLAARHPEAIPAVVVQATLGMAGAIIGEAALSFLGLGVQPPTPSWGTMLNGGRAHLLDAPHLTLFPGLAIALLVLGFNFVGDGLRDLDRSEAGDQASSTRPRSRARRLRTAYLSLGQSSQPRGRATAQRRRASARSAGSRDPSRARARSSPARRRGRRR